MRLNGSVVVLRRPSSAHLDRVDPGLGAADALHRGDGGSVKLADRQEAGVG